MLPRKLKTSKYLGVRKKKENQWLASVSAHCEQFYVGCFKTEKEAALAYNEKAIKLLGEKAKLNVITDD